MAHREIRIYKYTFSEGEPIEIEAENRVQARAMLNKVVYSRREFYQGIKLLGEYVIKPLEGVTKKIEKGIEWVWVGFEISPIDGWQEKFLYDMQLKKLREQSKIISLK